MLKAFIFYLFITCFVDYGFMVTSHMWWYIDVLDIYFHYCFIFYVNGGVILYVAITRFKSLLVHDHSLKKIKHKRLKTFFKTNPTNPKIHPRIIITLRNIKESLNNCFCHLKRARGPVFGGSGGGPSRDSVGGILSLTTSSCGEVTGWPWKLGWG